MQIGEVVVGSLGVVASLQIEVAQHEVDGEHHVPRVGNNLHAAAVGFTHFNVVAIGGHGLAGILGKLGSQGIADAADVLLVAHDVGIADVGDGVGVEGHAAIDLGQLQVGPGADAMSLHILGDGHLAATGEKGGVAVGNEVVAVVDDAIEHVGRIVLVLGSGREVGQGTQVGLGVLVDLCEVATHFVDEHVLVDGLLDTLENAEGVEHGVGLLVELRVEDLTV